MVTESPICGICGHGDAHLNAFVQTRSSTVNYFGCETNTRYPHGLWKVLTVMHADAKDACVVE